jgi:uncharacterized protein YkwD
MMRNLLLSLVVFTLSGVLCSPPVSAALYDDWADQEKQVFGLVNLQRHHHGLSDLTADSRLHDAAVLHSRDMAVNDYFDHDSQDGTSFDQRIVAQNYNYSYCSENIAAGYQDAYTAMYGTNDLERLSDFDVTLGNDGFKNWNEVGQGWSDADWEAWDRVIPQGWYGPKGVGFGGWMGSEGHRENILSLLATDIGVGYYYLSPDPGDRNAYHYWTQDFASGDSAAVPIPPAILLFGTGLAGLVGIRRYHK